MSVTISMSQPSAAPAPRGGVGPVGMLARRRAWRDRWMVIASTLVVALAAFLAYAGPQIVLGTLDEGAADAVRARPEAAAIDITFPVGNPGGDNLHSVKGVRVSSFGATADEVIAALPHDTASLTSGSFSAATSSPYTVYAVTSLAERTAAAEEDRDAAPERRGDVDLVFAVVPTATAALVEGSAPVFTPDQGPAAATDPEPAPLQISLTRETAQALGVATGDILTVGRANGARIDLLVTGLTTVEDGDGSAAELAPGLIEPEVRVGGTGADRALGTALLTDDAAAAFTSRVETPLQATVRLTVDPSALTLALAKSVPAELERLETRSDELLPNAPVTPRVSTGLGDALADYPVRARAALAQMSVLIAGVTAAAAAVITLMAHLLIAGRGRDIALERARGAGIGTTMIALLVESLTVTLAGVGVGYAAARVVTPGAQPLDPLVGLVALVSIVATPLLGARVARASWSGRREAANRSDRARAARAGAARRATRDALVAVLGAAAVWSLRGRGVLQTQTDGVDPFLAVAPALVALAVALIVARLYAVPQRLVRAVARRSRGAVGLLVSARARERVNTLALVALGLAIAVAASGALLASTVTRGQETASWERTGADVRLDAPVSEAQAEQWRADGLTVSRLVAAPLSTIALGSSLESATILAVDTSYADTIAEAGLGDTTALRSLADAARDWTPGDPLPALASEEILKVDVYARSDIFLGRTYLPVDYVGEATPVPDGWLNGPYVIVPLDALLASTTKEPVDVTTTLVTGEGAAAHVAEVAEATQFHTRSAWLDAARGSALIGGVQRAMTWAVAAVAALAAVGLLVSVATGARERARAVALLRTQGVPPRYGWWLALADLLPLVVAAAVAGAVSAVGVVVLLSPALGLIILSGGVSEPAAFVDPTHLALGGGALGALLLLAVIAEVTVQRRARLSEVLRYGETR